ncbi:hypothetical protein [Paenibacillus sp. WLX2291]|uniref:hypothetical protein n=1 Tax=Paenibacillus sp. WLX2291 TaxID=3296934 RepID=UPI0039844F8C
MMEQHWTLEQATAAFVRQHQDYNALYGLFAGNGFVEAGKTLDIAVDERIPLSPELQYVYSHYEIMDPSAEGSLKLKNAAVLIGDGILLCFAAPDYLDRLQLGHRWIGDVNAPQESEQWAPQHVVIATYNDDPIIADTSAEGTPVYVSFEGGDAELAAKSLADFFAALTLLIEAATMLGGEIQDEETYEVKDIYLKLVEPKLNELLGEEATNHLLVYLSLRW